MQLADYLTENHIMMNFEARDKAGALEALCSFAARAYGLEAASLLKVVSAREEMGSTGLGGGVALPHGKSPDINEPVLIAAVAPDGVEFDSLDGQPVHVFVLLVSPSVDEDGLHLKLLAKLGGVFKSPQAVSEVRAASSPAELRAVLARRDRGGR